MDLYSSRKSNKIREIVRLQQILKKWRKLAHANSSNKSIKFLKRTLSLSSDNNNNVSAAEAPAAVPKGHLAVWVGLGEEELKRYIIPTEYLRHEAFHILLREAEEEFGFQQTGVLQIPCRVSVFENIVNILEDHKKDNKLLMIFNNVVKASAASSGYCSSECPTPTHHHHLHPQSPMCR